VFSVIPAIHTYTHMFRFIVYLIKVYKTLWVTENSIINAHHYIHATQ